MMCLNFNQRTKHFFYEDFREFNTFVNFCCNCEENLVFDCETFIKKCLSHLKSYYSHTIYNTWCALIKKCCDPLFDLSVFLNEKQDNNTRYIKSVFLNKMKTTIWVTELNLPYKTAINEYFFSTTTLSFFLLIRETPEMIFSENLKRILINILQDHEPEILNYNENEIKNCFMKKKMFSDNLKKKLQYKKQNLSEKKHFFKYSRIPINIRNCAISRNKIKNMNFTFGKDNGNSFFKKIHF